jgi:hypothetical protein
MTHMVLRKGGMERVSPVRLVFKTNTHGMSVMLQKIIASH